MKIIRQFGIIFACIIIGVISPVHASVIYSYQGNNYNFFETGTAFDSTMSVSGTLELATALGPNLNNSPVSPISFSFNNGVDTINDTTNLEILDINFSTDSIGNIIEWYINLKEDYPYPPSVGDSTALIATFNAFGDAGDLGEVNICMGVTDDRCYLSGTFEKAWTKTNPGSWTVVPISPALWLFGSGLLGLIGIARRKKAT